MSAATADYANQTLAVDPAQQPKQRARAQPRPGPQHQKPSKGMHLSANSRLTPALTALNAQGEAASARPAWLGPTSTFVMGLSRGWADWALSGPRVPHARALSPPGLARWREPQSSRGRENERRRLMSPLRRSCPASLCTACRSTCTPGTAVSAVAPCVTAAGV